MHFAPILALAGFAAATVTTPVATPIATPGTNGTITGGNGGSEPTSTDTPANGAVGSHVPIAGLVGVVAAVLAL